MATLLGYDISHHQGVFDHARARREGFDFAILKATEGVGYTDDQFARNLSEARAAGLMVSAYHYQRGTSSAAAQASLIQQVVPRDCPVILDVEDGGGDNILTRDLTNRLNAAGWATPLLYEPRWYWQQLGSPDLSGLPPLWSSRYPDTKPGVASVIYQRVPASYWDGYGGNWVAVLQFSSSATVAGTSPVDVNAYGGTRDQLAGLLGGASTAPGGIEDMALDTQWTDSYGNVQTMQSWMADLQRKVNDLWYPAVSPGSVSSRIPGDANTTTVFDMIKDNTSWTNQTLGLVAGLRASSGVDPKAIADALRPVIADVIGPVIREAVTAALGADNEAQAEAIVSQIATRLAAGDAATD